MVKVTACKTCGGTVLVNDDGTCPSCGVIAAEPPETPAYTLMQLEEIEEQFHRQYLADMVRGTVLLVGGAVAGAITLLALLPGNASALVLMVAITVSMCSLFAGATHMVVAASGLLSGKSARQPRVPQATLRHETPRQLRP